MTSAEASERFRRIRTPYSFKGRKGGEWTHGAELIAQLVTGEKTLADGELQSELLDWILTDTKNVFRNRETKELVYALAAKRGNPAYAAKKNEQLDAILEAMADREFDFDVDGLRSTKYRMTRILLITATFSRKKYTAEQAWALTRSSGIEDAQIEVGALNRLGANISSIFGTNGKLTCKEADSSGYPAPHIIVILDRPVLVKRHNDRDGTVSWRLADRHVLKRVGKDRNSRKRSWDDIEAAISDNPIWSHGLMDIKGIVKGDGFGRFSNGFTYVFKYLIKMVSIAKCPELENLGTIKESQDKSLRTMMYTHLGNKCFRTRDIVFGKAFKDRIGLLRREESDRDSAWDRIKTIPAWVADMIADRTMSGQSG